MGGDNDHVGYSSQHESSSSSLTTTTRHAVRSSSLMSDAFFLKRRMSSWPRLMSFPRFMRLLCIAIVAAMLFQVSQFSKRAWEEPRIHQSHKRTTINQSRTKSTGRVGPASTSFTLNASEYRTVNTSPDRPATSAMVASRTNPVMVQVPKLLGGHESTDLSSVNVLQMHLSGLSMPERGEGKNYTKRKKHVHASHSSDSSSEDDIFCDPLGDWQESEYPTCSFMHEIDLNPHHNDQHENHEQVRLVNSGGLRDVWSVREYDGTRRALKTLRYDKRHWGGPIHERHRIEAVIMEQLTSSPLIADIYGYCGNSALAEFAPNGDLDNWIGNGKPKNTTDVLKIAHLVAASVADAHHLDSQGRATIAHTDLNPSQWILVNGEYQLNDFNSAWLLTWDPELNEECGFDCGHGGGNWRAPEEYNCDDAVGRTEKIDVYAMGNVLYCLLMDRTLEHGTKENTKNGIKPTIAKDIRNSNNVYHVAMVKAIDMCLELDPKKRTGARAVADLLMDALQNITTTATLSA